MKTVCSAGNFVKIKLFTRFWLYLLMLTHYWWPYDWRFLHQQRPSRVALDSLSQDQHMTQRKSIVVLSEVYLPLPANQRLISEWVSERAANFSVTSWDCWGSPVHLGTFFVLHFSSLFSNQICLLSDQSWVNIFEKNCLRNCWVRLWNY